MPRRYKHKQSQQWHADLGGEGCDQEGTKSKGEGESGQEEKDSHTRRQVHRIENHDSKTVRRQLLNRTTTSSLVPKLEADSAVSLLC